jgi:hypothetical protein
MVRNLCAALACAVLASSLAAGDEKQVDPKAFAAAMMKAGAVTEHHKKLEPLVGSFGFAIKMWMVPNQSPTESTGTSEGKWIMGNRFVRQEVKGEFAGMPFQGVGVSGYDNLKKAYVSAWIDNMSTSIMTASGTMSSDGKSITYTGEEVCPLTAEKLKVRDVTTFVDNNTIKSVYYRTMGGSEMKTMEITYTRKQ